MTSVVVRHSIAAHKASSSNLRPCSYCAKIACSGGGGKRQREEGRGEERREGEGIRTEIILFCKGVAATSPSFTSSCVSSSMTLKT